MGGLGSRAARGTMAGTLGCWDGQLSPLSAWALLMEAALQGREELGLRQ